MVNPSANTVSGAYSVTASVSGASASASFSLTNTPGAPSSVAAKSATTESASVGTAFAPLIVEVEDTYSNPVPNVTVTFTASAAGGATCTFGSGATTTATTGSNGQASATCTANTTKGGPYTVSAAVSGVSVPVTFNLTNTPPPPVIGVQSGSGQSAQVATAFAAPLVVTVTQGGSPLGAVQVTFSAPTSGASAAIAPNPATTNASGVATVSATANTIAGAYTVSATVPNATAPAVFDLTNNAGPAASIAATSGSGQSAQIGTAFSSPLVATVLDTYSNPVSGVTVTFTAPPSGASGTFKTSGTASETDTTNASGEATSSTFTANNSVGGPYTVTAAAAGVVATASFSLTNNATSACTGTLNNSLLKGNYAFMFKGFSGSSAAVSEAGSFVADGQSDGKITGGLLDVADQNANPATVSTTFTGTYCVGSDNLAIITINPADGKSETFAAAIDNTLDSGNRNGHIIGYDTSGKLISGLLRQQTTADFSTSSITGNYAFGLVGADQGGNRFTIAGQFDSNGGSMNGEADFDDAGSIGSGNINLSATGFSVASNGRGTASILFTALSTPDQTVNFVFYVVNSNELVMMALDSTEQPPNTTPMTMTGRAFAQASNLSNSTINGTAVLSMADVDGTVAETEGGFLTATSATTSFSLNLDDMDVNNGGLTSQTIMGNYSVASDGRMTLSNVTGCRGGCNHTPVFYVFGTNDAFEVGTGGSGQFGEMTAQTGTSFSASSLSGAYLGGTEGPVIDSGSVSVADPSFSSGNETISGTSDKNSVSGPPQKTTTDTEPISADYCPATTGITCASSSNGRFLVTCPSGSTSCTPGSLQNIIYAISDTEWVIMDADSGDSHPKLEAFHQ